MATGIRLLTQVMPSQYRQGDSYPVKSWRKVGKTRFYGKHRIKKYGQRLLRNALEKDLLSKIENIE